jgi:inorganic pyrophosphatase
VKIVTSGAPYIDIDAYAGSIAYAELLNLQGEAAVAVSTSTWNESITATIRAWQAPLKTKYIPEAEDTFALVDVSDPDYLDDVVDPTRVSDVFDHHPGFEAFWRGQPQTNAQLEIVGAACTMIFEHWRDSGRLAEMSVTSAKLLAAGILDNTLNFQARITTPRDHKAYDVLARHAKLGENWPAEYFSECQSQIVSNLPAAILNDTKILKFSTLPHETSVGQLVVWDASPILAGDMTTIRNILSGKRPDWFMNIVSVGDKRSYLFCESPDLKKWLSDLLNIRFRSDVAPANRLWLRKEIMNRELGR